MLSIIMMLIIYRNDNLLENYFFLYKVQTLYILSVDNNNRNNSKIVENEILDR